MENDQQSRQMKLLASVKKESVVVLLIGFIFFSLFFNAFMITSVSLEANFSRSQVQLYDKFNLLQQRQYNSQYLVLLTEMELLSSKVLYEKSVDKIFQYQQMIYQDENFILQEYQKNPLPSQFSRFIRLLQVQNFENMC